MRKALLAGLVALLAPAATHAQVELGLRIGYGVSGGSAFKDNSGALLGAGETEKMSNSLEGQVPAQLDASYRFSKDIAAGFYVSYGYGVMSPKECSDSNINCDTSARVFRWGVQGVYTFNQVRGTLVPWAGLFLGREQAAVEYKINAVPAGAPAGLVGEKVKYALSGYEIGLQVGGDYKLNPWFSFGPYLTGSYGQYSHRNITLPENAPQYPPPDFSLTTHGWLGVGVLGRFSL